MLQREQGIQNKLVMAKSFTIKKPVIKPVLPKKPVKKSVFYLPAGFFKP
jgi:hypothetical protein